MKIFEFDNEHDPVFGVLQCLFSIVTFCLIVFISAYAKFELFGNKDSIEFIGPLWISFLIVNITLFLPALCCSFISIAIFKAFSKELIILQIIYSGCLCCMMFLTPIKEISWRAMFSVEKLIAVVIYVLTAIIIKKMKILLALRK